MKSLSVLERSERKWVNGHKVSLGGHGSHGFASWIDTPEIKKKVVDEVPAVRVLS